MDLLRMTYFEDPVARQGTYGHNTVPVTKVAEGTEQNR